MFIDNMDMLDECPKIGIFIIPTYKYIWVCKNGMEIDIKDMSINHIKNSISMIKKSIKANKPWRENFLEPLTRELKRRYE